MRVGGVDIEKDGEGGGAIEFSEFGNWGGRC